MNVTQIKEDAAIAVIILQACIPVLALQGKVCIVTLTLTISAWLREKQEEELEIKLESITPVSVSVGIVKICKYIKIFLTCSFDVIFYICQERNILVNGKMKYFHVCCHDLPFIANNSKEMCALGMAASIRRSFCILLCLTIFQNKMK